jgi:DNA polymerase III delta subunit
MITLLTGANEYAINAFLAEREAAFVAEHDESGVEKHYGEDISPGQLLDYIQGGSLFAADRLVIIRNPGENKELSQHLPNLLERIAEDTELLLVEPKPDKRTSWYKALVKKQITREFAPLNTPQLIRWAQTYAADKGAKLSADASRHLVERAGNNQLGLARELDKLVLAKSPINTATVDQLVEPSLNESVFSLIDAVCAGRAARAHVLYETMRKSEVDPYQFVNLLAWQINAMLVVKANPDTSQRELASTAGLAPFVVSKLSSSTRAVPLVSILRAADVVLTADTRMKKTRADAVSVTRVLIDQLALIFS